MSIMKRKAVLSFLLFTVFALCVAVSCTDEDDPYYSSKRQLLGKWELVAFGNSWNNMIVVQKPGGYYEYLSDNTIRHFSYETQKYDSIKSAYYMDSLLHVGSIAYKYSFHEDKMDLLITNVLAEFNNFRYKRVK
jgi:hypothetical protein